MSHGPYGFNAGRILNELSEATELVCRLYGLDFYNTYVFITLTKIFHDPMNKPGENLYNAREVKKKDW